MRRPFGSWANRRGASHVSGQSTRTWGATEPDRRPGTSRRNYPAPRASSPPPAPEPPARNRSPCPERKRYRNARRGLPDDRCAATSTIRQTPTLCKLHPPPKPRRAPKRPAVWTGHQRMRRSSTPKKRPSTNRQTAATSSPTTVGTKSRRANNIACKILRRSRIATLYQPH